MARYSLHRAAMHHARELIGKHQYVHLDDVAG